MEYEIFKLINILILCGKIKTLNISIKCNSTRSLPKN